jgi:hypothetical protein
MYCKDLIKIFLEQRVQKIIPNNAEFKMNTVIFQILTFNRIVFSLKTRV